MSTVGMVSLQPYRTVTKVGQGSAEDAIRKLLKAVVLN